MPKHRDLAKKLLPDRFVDWYRARRVAILESAGGATRITPGLLVRMFWRKLSPIRDFFRRIVVRILPKSVVNKLRARRARKRYLKALGYELLERETRLDYLEGRVAARRDGFYERIVKDVLERTELILQELDRRIEGVSARTGERLNAVEEQLVQLREEIGRLRQLSDPALRDVGDRARAEIPEIASVEGHEDGVAGERSRPGDRDGGESGGPASGTGSGTGNGRIAAGAPAITPAAPRPE